MSTRVRATSRPVEVVEERPDISLSALVAAVTGAMVDALYVWIIAGQDGNTWHDAARFGTLIGSAVVAALIAAFVVYEPLRLGCAAAAASVFLGATVLGAMSIGVLLLPPTAASVVCVSRTGARAGYAATWLAAAGMAFGTLAVIGLYW